MDKFNARTFRLLIVTIVVCTLFVVCLPFAYRNVPKNNYQEYKPTYETNTVTEDSYKENTQSEITNQESSKVEKDKNSKADKEKISKVDKENRLLPKLQPIDENDNTKDITSVEQDLFSKPAAMRQDGSYESAVYEYEKIAKNTNDEKIKAKCYEEIARTYASIKRYGSALSYAQKAFNTVPNSDREVLLARLYYKTGNSEKANERINAVLKRDFDE